MTLNPLPIHPSAGAYLVRLHRDARPGQGLLIGRIQHVASGDWADFASSDALLDWMRQHAVQLQTEQEPPANGASS